MNQLKHFLIFSVVLLLCSCSAKSPSHKNVTPSADSFINQILSINSSRYPVTGTGQFIVNSENKTQKFKTAFASDGLKRIRLEILSPAGLPAVSIACDGEKLYYRENDGSSTRIFSDNKKILKKVTGISPDIRIISFLLAKKIPLIDFNQALTDETFDQEALFLFSEKEKQSVVLKRSSKGFFSEIQTPEDKFIIDFEENGTFRLISEKTGGRILFSPGSHTPLKNELLKNIFILTR